MLTILFKDLKSLTHGQCGIMLYNCGFILCIRRSLSSLTHAPCSFPLLWSFDSCLTYVNSLPVLRLTTIFHCLEAWTLYWFDSNFGIGTQNGNAILSANSGSVWGCMPLVGMERSQNFWKKQTTQNFRTKF